MYITIGSCPLERYYQIMKRPKKTYCTVLHQGGEAGRLLRQEGVVDSDRSDGRGGVVFPSPGPHEWDRDDAVIFIWQVPILS